jgi:hypothetical protein
VDVAQTGIPRVDEASSTHDDVHEVGCGPEGKPGSVTYRDAMYYQRVEWMQPHIVQQVKHEDIDQWRRLPICGRIPADCDPESWVWKTITEKYPDTEAFCIKGHAYWLLRSK